VTIVAWIGATWVLSSLIAGPLIGRFIGYGLDENPAPAQASGNRQAGSGPLWRRGHGLEHSDFARSESIPML
jgi:hypothetical protein